MPKKTLSQGLILEDKKAKISDTNSSNDSSDNRDFISLTEAAFRCSYTQEYLSLLARRGNLKANKLGRNWVTTKAWLIEYLEAHPQKILAYRTQLIALKKEVSQEQANTQSMEKEKAAKKILADFGGSKSSRPLVVLREPTADRLFYFFADILRAPVVSSVKFLMLFIRGVYELLTLSLWGFIQGLGCVKSFFVGLLHPLNFYNQTRLILERLPKLQRVRVVWSGVFVFAFFLSSFLNLALPVFTQQFNYRVDNVVSPMVNYSGRFVRGAVLTVVGCDAYLRKTLPRGGDLVVQEFARSYKNVFSSFSSIGQNIRTAILKDTQELVQVPKSRIMLLQKFGYRARHFASNFLLTTVDKFGQVAGVNEGEDLDSGLAEDSDWAPQQLGGDSLIAEQTLGKVITESQALSFLVADKLSDDVGQFNVLAAGGLLAPGRRAVLKRVSQDAANIAGLSRFVAGYVLAAQAAGEQEVAKFSAPFETQESKAVSYLESDWQELAHIGRSDIKEMKQWLVIRLGRLKDSGNKLYDSFSALLGGVEDGLGNTYLVLSDFIHKSTKDDFYSFDGLVRETPRSLDKPGPTTAELAAGKTPQGVVGAGGDETGAVVAPLTEEETKEETVARLKESFSDKVEFEFDSDKETGTIRPVHPATPEEKYLYVIVPVRE
ncbi:hypothetical protein KKD19_05045 [Patescibacteria group bacterium]|nr:hypothetical protein [Patescibacteria group bacterium]MBU4512574.1 hypothetical protein [Patescibacteria group bacterium]MCG2692813.1 hypothetical protein [Candidatus Parcubacteria bacterium]